MSCLLFYFMTFVLLVKGSSDCDGSTPIIAKVKQGNVRGSSMVSDTGRHFCAFRGIPYAQPPVGRLRFRPPEPLKSWKWVDTLSATREGDECVHPSFVLPVMRGSEDCLYLNVYTPWMNATEGELLDVMVFISPGQFYYSSGSSTMFGPEYLIDKNVVLVTFNYRLGVFGFLSTQDDESPGNYGMKDQVAALTWVKENIRAFSGNPSSITVFGEGAGGASVHYHMMSPLTDGLFHRAISMEGTAIMPWARSKNPLHQAKKQAYLVGCPTAPSNKLVECLRGISPTQLNRSIYKLFDLWYLPGPGFAPVVEKSTSRNPKPYMTEDPLQMIALGNFRHIPWIIGGNTQSAATFFVPILNINLLRKRINRDLWPSLLMLPDSVTVTNVYNVLGNISRFYDVDFHFQSPEQDMRTLTMLSDRYYHHGTYKTAQLHVQAGHSSIYQYNFAYRGVFSFTLATSLHDYGVSLGDELRYLFQLNVYTKRHRKLHIPYKSANDKEVQQLMLSLWTNFAKYGTPTPSQKMKDGDSWGDLTWTPMDYGMQYLNIGQVQLSPITIGYMQLGLGPVRLNMAQELNKNRMDFWDSLPLEENIKLSPIKSNFTYKSGSGQSTISIYLTIVCIICHYWTH